MVKEVTIVLVGDAKTGKSSLAACLVSKSFNKQIINVIPPITLPTTFFPNHKLPITVIDTSSNDSEKEKLEREKVMKIADVICIVFDVQNKNSLISVKEKWINQINQLKTKPPVILIGNKTDIQLSTEEQNNIIKSIIQTSSFVFHCIFTSAKTNTNVDAAFDHATSVVLYPPGALFCYTNEHEIDLSDKYKEALRRIFLLLDKNRDGIINDDELLAYQQQILPKATFNEITSLKRAIQQKIPDGVSPGGINISGFLYAHKLLLHSKKFEPMWKLLRKYGYNNSLILAPSYLSPKIVDESEKFCGKELSHSGANFVKSVFKQFAKGESLNEENMNQVFATAPSNLFPNAHQITQSVANPPNSITKDGFVNLWRMQTLLDYTVTMKYMRYLGYNQRLSEAITVYEFPGEPETLRIRNTFLGFVAGTPGCKKTQLLSKFLGSQTKSNRVINSFVVDDQRKYFILEKVSLRPGKTSKLASVNAILTCDVLILTYQFDDDTSFDSLCELYSSIHSDYKNIPCILLVSHSSSHPNPRAPSKVLKFCKQYSIKPPIFVCLEDSSEETIDVINSLPLYACGKLRGRNYFFTKTKLLVSTLLLAGITAGVGYWFYRQNKSSSKSI